MPRLYPIRGGVKPPLRKDRGGVPGKAGTQKPRKPPLRRTVAAFPARPGRRNRESRLYEGPWRRSRQGRDAETAKAASTKGSWRRSRQGRDAETAKAASTGGTSVSCGGVCRSLAYG